MVDEGQQIAVSGNTGKYTTGPHLHYGIKISGKWVDPMSIISVKPEKVTIEGKEFDAFYNQVDGKLYVEVRGSHEEVGNRVDWTSNGTVIVPIPKMKLKLIKEIL